MKEPAPKGIEPIKKPVIVDELGHQTEERISKPLNQMGYPTTAQSISPDHSSILKGVKELGGEVLDASHGYLETKLEELKGGTPSINTTHGKKAASATNERAKLKEAA